MNINRQLVFFVLALQASSIIWAIPPTAIIDLNAQTGSEAGTVDLDWSAPNEGGNAVQEYRIRYRPNNQILSIQDWNSAALYPSAPTPASPGNPEQYTISGLTPGVSYYFAVISRGTDPNAPFSPLSNSVSANAKDICVAGPHDGEGSATITPTTVQVGADNDFTLIFTPGANSISPGGKLSFRIPNGWTEPTTSGSASSTPGHISYSPVGNGATVDIEIDERTVTATVTGGTSLVSLYPISIHYNNAVAPCAAAGGQEEFLFASQQLSCGELIPLQASDQNADVNVNTGIADHIGFKFPTLPVILTNTYPIELVVRDTCNNKVTSPGSINVWVQPQKIVSNSNVPDTEAVASLNSNLSNPFPITGGDIPFSVGDSSKTFYYSLTTNSQNPPRMIVSSHTASPYPFYDNIQILPISGGITNASVDTGTLSTGQTSVTFTPDGDNNTDVAFINFQMPAALYYRVELSSDNFASIVRTFYGFGSTARISWYGDRDTYNFGGPDYVPAGIYAIRIADQSNTVTDQSLSLIVSAGGITGIVEDSGTNQALHNANIRLYGSNYQRYFRSDSNGEFTSYGIKPGTYQMQVEKTGYLTEEFSVTVPSGLLNQGTIRLDPAATLKINFTRPSSTNLPEVWGNLRANTSNWSSQAYASVHFAEGRTESDAGDFWNSVPSSYSVLSINPGVQYTVSLEIPNYGMSPVTRTVTTSLEEVISLTRRPNISGEINVPQGSNPNGMFISIEACIVSSVQSLTCDNQNSSNRFYGGTFLVAGSSFGAHMIPGVNDGLYLLTARAPGFVAEKIHATVSGGTDVTNANFPVLDQGGNITGTITVNGDSSSLDDDSDGYFDVPVNCWSPTNYSGSSTEIQLATSATTTSGNYTLNGLEDGSYQIFVNLNGFEVTPPGQITASVASGAGTRNITLQEYTGSLSGNITIPGGGLYTNVTIDLLPLNSFTSDPISTNPDVNGAYNFNQLGTGYYTLRGYYSTTGYLVEKNVTIANGQATTKNLDLTGNTYTLSGTVDTSASSPFNTLNYLVNGTSPTVMLNLVTNSTVAVAANRIVAERMRDNEYFGGPNNSGGSSAIPYDPRRTFFGFYDANGDYSISNLSPGVYRVYNNGELDFQMSTGKEIAEQSRIIHISGNKTEDFDLIDGYEISGSLIVDNGIPETNKELDVFLQDTDYQAVAYKRVNLTGTSASFTIENIPNGSYLLAMRETSPTPKYVAKDILVEVDGSDVTGKQIRLETPARIKGKFRIATSGELLTAQNYDQFLTESFRIEARSNPWVQGAFGYANYPLIDQNGEFNIYALGGYTYDLLIRTDGFIGEAAIAQGKKQFISYDLSGNSLVSGQTLDLGIIDLEEGVLIRGTVTDRNLNPLPNILVVGREPGSHNFEDQLETTTNHLGQFTLYGANPAKRYNIKAAPRPDPYDRRFRNLEGSLYGESIRKNVIPGGSPISFQLDLAQGSVQGTVVTPDNGPLYTPFDRNSEPGAMIIMNKLGNTPENNPLGDIEAIAEADGSFEIKGLTPGTYNLWALAEGYANGISRNIVVQNSPTNIGNVLLSTGSSLTGTITKPDSSLPNINEINGLIAVRAGFEDLIIAKMDTDALGNITAYTISGFRNNLAYDIVSFSENDEITVLASNLIVNEDTQLNFVLSENAAPRALKQAKKNQDGTITITYEFSKALRNSQIDLDNDLKPDDQPDESFTLISGNGTLDIDNENLSSDRKRFVTTYTPAAGDTRFAIRADLTFNAVDSSNEYLTLTEDTSFYIGIGATASEVITNLNGGSVELEDGSAFSTVPGTFGDGASDEIEVTLRAADDESELAGAAPNGSALSIANRIGLRSYPTGMAAAISKVKTMDVSPFSSFYDIFLPAGVNHFFPEGSEAQLCLNYDDSVSDTDAYSMNIYYFNEDTNEYILEQENKSVDTENNLICASIAHASVFTILNSSASIISGGSYTGDLKLLNFPNPFNLKPKNVTLQDPGSATASQSVEGTMIKMSIPSSMSGGIEIEIFNVAGEKVRTLTSQASGGAHFYLEWDGRNDHGEKVASGTYIARFTIGGSNERFFKMAVLK